MTERIETVVVGGGQAGLAHEPRADPSRKSSTSCSSGAGSGRPGAAAGTASASSRRTGPFSCPATTTTATTRTASCPRRDRRLPGALRGRLRRTGPRGRRGRGLIRAWPTAASSSRPRRRAARGGRGRQDRRVSAAARLRGADGLPATCSQIDVADFRNRGSASARPRAVVGSGQSGCQIAEELHDAGREVFLSCGTRRGLRAGSATTTWSGGLDETGYLDSGVESLPTPVRPTCGQRPVVGPRRRPRPAPPDASGARGRPHRPSSRRRRTARRLRAGSGRERRVG